MVILILFFSSVADISGLANIIAEANKRAFLTSACINIIFVHKYLFSIHSNYLITNDGPLFAFVFTDFKLGTRVLEKNLTDYSRVDIEEMQLRILRFTHDFKFRYIETLKTWNIKENSFKYVCMSY